MVYSNNEILYNNENEQISRTCNPPYDPHKNNTEWKKPNNQRGCAMQFHLYKVQIFIQAKLIKEGSSQNIGYPLGACMGPGRDTEGNLECW